MRQAGRRGRSCTGLLLVLCFAGQPTDAADKTFTNPILPGGYPDPSICRDGDDYYLVNSTFEYFPGLPVHHSRDLVNWRLIGHGLHRMSQVSGAVNLLDVQSDGGIHAPSIRCHEGRFYIITTNVYQPPGGETRFVNFVITADDPAGPWSEPQVLEGAPGIDPDLFFDEDGRVWYVGTHSPENPDFQGQGEIWLQEIDAANWRLTGERHFLWRGACGGVWTEGPHIYRKNNRYYLMVAEGGTSFNHAVMVAVSDEITGPYHSNPRNPILTSRHLSYDNWVNSTGHGDLVELQDGRWYMVALGIRGDEQRRSNMGRETHLLPVRWETEPFWWQEVNTEWPVAAPGTGRVERYTALPFADSPQYRKTGFHDGFDAGRLKPDWNFRRPPLPGSYSLTDHPGHLRLYARANEVRERGRASLIGVRQTESDFVYTIRMLFEPRGDKAEAGMMVFQKDNNYLGFTVNRRAGEHWLVATLAVTGQDARRGEDPVELERRRLTDYAGHIQLRLISKDRRYRLQYSPDDGEHFTDFASTAAHHLLSKGYTGAYLGLYSTGGGAEAGDYADFDWVGYEGFER